MASRGTRKVGTHRMDGAIAALTPLGFSKNLIRDTIRELIKVYGDNDAAWYFVEENYYKLVIDKIIEEQDEKMQEHDVNVEEEESKASVEAGTTETCGQTLLKLEAGSSNNRELSSMVRSMHERATIKLEVPCDMVAGVDLSQVNPSSRPRRSPCYGWISEDED